MTMLKTILIVDDNIVGRAILSKIISRKYAVLEAENGQAALDILEHNNEISAVMLDLVMPIMDGYAVLKKIKEDDRHNNLPIIVTTGSDTNENERRALSLGAWDFVSKPYDAEIIMFRLENSIERSQLSALKELKYLAEYDSLTGIYNKAKFFEATRAMIDASRGEVFVFLRFDVDRFQLINSFFGTDEGDKLLKYIAKNMSEETKRWEKATYGRISSDIFGACLPYEKDKIKSMICQSKKTLAQYNTNYDIVPSIGIYIVDDNSISIEEMYNRAALAAKNCKGNYVDFYTYYNESMSALLSNEQEITNEMNFALKNGQFEIYLQPKYNIHTNLPCCAEALARWRHPKKGLLSPGSFISVFERNGFITKLDYHVWEQACRCLHDWISRGITPYPISVNVSRVNIYNPKLVETLMELVERYELKPSLLNLELTESAYTDNPIAMKKAMSQLQSHGFIIMMDDFGSGYSSLALLKDIMVDVLKIDMQFLSISEFPGRGENIIASVIRMAKWLNIPVIAEGAETIEQVEFLRSVGCDFVQGYYYARPMPPLEYEQLCFSFALENQIITDQKYSGYCYDDLFSLNNDMKLTFDNNLQVTIICEFFDDKIEIVRVNEAYYTLVGYEDIVLNSSNVLDMIDSQYRASLLHAFQFCAKTMKSVDCEYMRLRKSGSPLWIDAKLRYVTTVGNKHIIIVELTDITMRKGINDELEKYKASLLESEHEQHTVLIVDDAIVNRTVLKKILKKNFTFLEAGNGEEAIKIIKENIKQIDLIMLDISMPIMDGKEFLQYKKNSPELARIPVIMITSDESPQQQISTFSLGANDYIVKPFIPEVVTRRVGNVLDFNRRFRDMVREYNMLSAQVKTDLMTGLINRVSVEKMISLRLEDKSGIGVMIMLDIDNFKQINDIRGHDYGDKVICAVAEKLRLHFREEDIIARMGGDQFAMFVSNIPDTRLIETKARQLCESMADIMIDGENANVSCSLGIAVTTKEAHSFKSLYQNSDKALYNAKCRGKSMFSIYGEVSSYDSKWVNDAESVLDIVKDSIYICEKETYDLIYVNNNLCELMNIKQEGCKGKKCYEILMGRTKPCKFCSMQKMIEGKMYTRLFHMPNSSQVYLMRGENINRDGTNIHLEVAVDVTEMKNKNLQWHEVESYD